MSLPVDFKIDKIIKQIAEETGQSYNTILSVINQQVNSTISGMEQGHTIVWKYFGTFIATQKRVDSLNKSYQLKGKKPTLIDTGFDRVSFTRKGELVAESQFSPSSKKDIL